MTGANMKKKSLEMSDFYRNSLSKGLVIMSDAGVLTRDIIGTLRSAEGKAIAGKAVKKLSEKERT